MHTIALLHASWNNQGELSQSGITLHYLLYPSFILGPQPDLVSLSLTSCYWVHLKQNKAVHHNLQGSQSVAGITDMSPRIPVISLNLGLNLDSNVSTLLIIWKTFPSYFWRKESCSFSLHVGRIGRGGEVKIWIFLRHCDLQNSCVWGICGHLTNVFNIPLGTLWNCLLQNRWCSSYFLKG